LAGAVTVSAVVALTLTPMCCAFLLRPPRGGSPTWNDRVVAFIDARMEGIRRRYQRMLTSSLKTMSVTVVFAALVLSSIYWLYANSKSELAPQEDQGVILTQSTYAPNATLEQKLLYAAEINKRFQSHPEAAVTFQIINPGVAISGVVLKPWDQRNTTADALQPLLQREVGGVAGAQTVAFQPSPLPGSNGLPVQFVIQSTAPFEQLNRISATFLAAALRTGKFIFLTNDLKIDQPQTAVVIDREKTSQLGLRLSDVGGTLGSMLGGQYVNYFDLAGRSYKVIPQVEQRSRLNTDQVLDYYIKTSGGVAVPLSTVASLSTATIPESLNHFQQFNAATISGVVAPGVSTSEALATLREIADNTLPAGYAIDYGGALRQFVQESGGLAVTFGFALVIIFLALSAQFESFRDPLIILVSVPMSIAGALIFIMLGVKGASLNIYTEVGLVTLMGLISKHGILIVEFANELQHVGRSKREAAVEATAIRLRPILMTTAAMVFGVVPLITASGAGAASRFNMGLVIASGLSIGTLFTLFVVPAVYILLAADHSQIGDKKEGRENVDPLSP
jgi:multidrug efflux pump